MLGAILGDIVGEPYEFDRGKKIKDFGPLFTKRSKFTDDSVMTVAVAEALLKSGDDADTQTIRENVISSMQKWGGIYPYKGYGVRFNEWLRNKNSEPYGSWGNGSAMRVSSAGWLYETLEDTRKAAAATADVTHNHIQGIIGAEATASAIWLAREKYSKKVIKAYIEDNFYYDLSRTLDEIRPNYKHVESCMQTVPEAITSFLESWDFEDAVRNAVSLGGDCDTLTCITAAIAEAYYGIPEEYQGTVISIIDPDMKAVLENFQNTVSSMTDADSFWEIAYENS